MVVLPTPPLPPTKTHFRFDSTMLRSDASGRSPSPFGSTTAMPAAAMLARWMCDLCASASPG